MTNQQKSHPILQYQQHAGHKINFDKTKMVPILHLSEKEPSEKQYKY